MSNPAPVVTESIDTTAFAETLTSVVVEQKPYGSTQASQATADVFSAGELTVSCTDPDYDRKYGPIRVFKPGSWINATVYDSRGNVLASFVAPPERIRLVTLPEDAHADC